MTRAILLNSLVLLNLMGLCEAQQLQTRNWTGTHGVKVEAAFGSYDDESGVVTLWRPVTVPIDRLSREDQAYVKALSKSTVSSENSDNSKPTEQNGTLGRWVWHCPAPNEKNWRIDISMFDRGGKVESVERSSGHSTSPTSKTTYYFRRLGEVFVPLHEMNEDKMAVRILDKHGNLRAVKLLDLSYSDQVLDYRDIEIYRPVTD